MDLARPGAGALEERIAAAEAPFARLVAALPGIGRTTGASGARGSPTRSRAPACPRSLARAHARSSCRRPASSRSPSQRAARSSTSRAPFLRLAARLNSLVPARSTTSRAHAHAALGRARGARRLPRRAGRPRGPRAGALPATRRRADASRRYREIGAALTRAAGPLPASLALEGAGGLPALTLAVRQLRTLAEHDGRPARPRARSCATSARRRDRVGRDRRAVRGRGARRTRAHLRGRAATTTRSSTSPGSSRATTTPYEVRLDGGASGRRGQPVPAVEPIRTHRAGPPLARVRLLPRVRAARGPALAAQGRGPRGREVDALRAAAERMRERPPRVAARAVLLGDQVYADEVSPETREFIRSRRDPRCRRASRSPTSRSTPGSTASRGPSPTIRWLLSTVPTAMIFDDHDVHDDWNTSRDWVDEMRATGWWDERIIGGFASYWLYQHIGNLAPQHLAEDGALRAGCARPTTPSELLREFGFRADREVAGHALELLPRLRPHAPRDDRLARGPRARPAGRALDGRPGGVGLDHRARHGRLRPPADRDLAAAPARARAARPRGVERGGLRRRLGHGAPRGSGRRSARRVDLEHWAAFGSCRAHPPAGRGVGGTAARPARPRSSRSRATSTTPTSPRWASAGHRDALARLPGDVLAVPQPARRPRADDGPLRVLTRGAAARRPAARASAGVEKPKVRWRFAEGPYFDNQVCFLELDGPLGAPAAAEDRAAAPRASGTRATGWRPCSSAR